MYFKPSHVIPWVEKKEHADCKSSIFFLVVPRPHGLKTVKEVPVAFNHFEKSELS